MSGISMPIRIQLAATGHQVEKMVRSVRAGPEIKGGARGGFWPGENSLAGLQTVHETSHPRPDLTVPRPGFSWIPREGRHKHVSGL